MRLYMVLCPTNSYLGPDLVAAETAGEAIAVVMDKAKLWKREDVRGYVAWELTRGTKRSKPGRVYGLTPDCVAGIARRADVLLPTLGEVTSENEIDGARTSDTFPKS